MLYGYFRGFNIICNIFGLIKPPITDNGKSIKINLLLKIWSLLVVVGLISSCLFYMDKLVKFNIRYHLAIIPDINDLVVNSLIIIINIINSEEICINLHEIFDAIFRNLNLNENTLKLFAYKLYVRFSGVMVIFIISIILEFLFKYPPYILLTRLPTVLSMMYLIVHLCLILAVLKVINHELSKTLIFKSVHPKKQLKETIGIKSIIKYVASSSLFFFGVNHERNFDLKILCKIYDNLSTCVHLLEKCCGVQILLSIWLMFTSAVIGVTVIVRDEHSVKQLVIIKCILPFFWCFIGCYINEQLRKEVDKTRTLIIKCLIDYRCIQSRKPVLETFKELVSNDRLQFTACSLFKLSYSMLLGTLLNVITYSIILIQLF